jgi:GTP-binding protein
LDWQRIWIEHKQIHLGPRRRLAVSDDGRAAKRVAAASDRYDPGPMLHPADPNLRNVAIIAHVDHGKTTLVDAMLDCCGSLSQARCRTPIASSTPIRSKKSGASPSSPRTAPSPTAPIEGEHAGETFRINLIDTPGHADFGGEVERVLKMADGVLLLVDAFEGPMPQTRFVLGKALELDLPLIVVVNKCDRPNARPDAVVDEVFDLLVALEASDERLDFPVIYASGATAGRRGVDR